MMNTTYKMLLNINSWQIRNNCVNRDMWCEFRIDTVNKVYADTLTYEAYNMNDSATYCSFELDS